VHRSTLAVQVAVLHLFVLSGLASLEATTQANLKLLLLRTFSSLIGGELLALMLFTMSCKQQHSQANQHHFGGATTGGQPP
jgi:hypothetical protein